MNIILAIVLIAVAFVLGLFIAYMMTKRNAKSAAHEILEKARLEAEVLKNNEVIKGKEEGMSIQRDAEKQANARLSKVQSTEAKLKQREMQLNQQQGEVQRKRNEVDSLKSTLDHQSLVLDERKKEVDRLEKTVRGGKRGADRCCGQMTNKKPSRRGTARCL